MSKKETSTSQSSATSAPWAPQIPYLQNAFSEAQKLYGQGTDNLYSGQQLAQFNPDQLATFQSMLDYGGSSGIPGQSQAAGTSLLGAGQGALGSSLSGLQGFTPSGSTESNIAAANQYADNPAIGGMVDAAMRDSVRNASESVLPALARQSAAGGNLNSSRTAISQGLVQRGLADQAGDISAGLRGNAYSQGLNLAQQGSQFNDTAILDALKSGGALGSGASGMGLGALQSAMGQQGTLFDMANAGGAGIRAGQQAGIDNAKMMSEYASGAPFDLLAKYFGIVGNTGYGSQTTGTQTGTKTSSDPMGSIGAGMNIFGSLFSDRRVKQDIKQVGFLDNGLPVYSFRYKGSEAYTIGLMADEVEKLHPEAVGEVGGFKTVNYKLAAV